jgi:hypothetical protein
MKFFSMSKLSHDDLKQVLDSRYCGFIDFCCAIFLSNCVATQGLGYSGLQMAGIPWFQRIHLSNAGFPHLLTFVMYQMV